jgi:hypothetical protein
VLYGRLRAPPGTYFLDVNYYYSVMPEGRLHWGSPSATARSEVFPSKPMAEAMLALAPLFLWVGKMSAAILMSLLR